MVPVKQNLAPNIGGLAYRVEAPDGVPILAWERDPVWVKADDILGNWDAQDRNETNEAKDWLRELLADGPMETKIIQQRARAAGLSWTTVRRAKDTLGVVPNKDGYQGAWQWQIKDAHSKDAHPYYSQMSTFDGVSTFDDENSSGRTAHPCSHCGGSGKSQSSCPRCTSIKHCCVCGGVGLSARRQ